MRNRMLRMQREDRLPAHRLRVRHTVRLVRNRRARPLHNLLPRLHRAVPPIAQQHHHHAHQQQRPCQQSPPQSLYRQTSQTHRLPHIIFSSQTTSSTLLCRAQYNHLMADQLYLSLWFPNFRLQGLPDALVCVLRQFITVSREAGAHPELARVAAASAYPIDWTESPIYQRIYVNDERSEDSDASSPENAVAEATEQLHDD